MQIILEGLTKKFPKHKLFENLNYTFETDNTYAITGENGSGKSTLINIIAGVVPSTKGKVEFIKDQETVKKEEIYQLLGITAPYLSLIEELTLEEHINFHSKFKSTLMGVDIWDELEKASLLHSRSKLVGEFSSGMKQRLKLILCCSFQSEVLLLDEPSSHLDSRGLNWYKELIERTKRDRVILIASNDPDEYKDFAQKIIHIGG